MEEIDLCLIHVSDGCESAFRRLYDYYAPSVYRTAFRYLQSADLSNDIVQEVFSIIWQRRNQLSEIRNFESYLITMARNATYREMGNWANEVRSRGEYLTQSDSYYNNSEDELLSSQYNDLLVSAVQDLPPQQRTVFELVKYEGMTHEAIAQQMGLSHGTVKNHMVRALGFIRKRLMPHLTAIALLLSLH